MSAPDVLAVMQASADQLWRYRRDILAREEEEARAAVAELVEAATVICGTLRDDTDVSRQLGTSAILPFRKMRAALARFTDADFEARR